VWYGWVFKNLCHFLNSTCPGTGEVLRSQDSKIRAWETLWDPGVCVSKVVALLFISQMTRIRLGGFREHQNIFMPLRTNL
jgi:hypothetical protein